MHLFGGIFMLVSYKYCTLFQFSIPSRENVVFRESANIRLYFNPISEKKEEKTKCIKYRLNFEGQVRKINVNKINVCNNRRLL